MSGLDATVASGTTAVDGVQEIEVYEALGEPTRFRVRLGVPVIDDDLPALADPLVDPGSEISIVSGGEMLVKGPVTGHRVHLSGEDQTSTLDVVGGDRLLELAREARITSWSMMRASDVVGLIALGYGMIPDVEATGTFYSPISNDLVQRGSDFDFIRGLARRHGYLLWLSLGPMGAIEFVHFKPPPVAGGTTTKLEVHLPGSALDEIDIEWDSDRPTSVTMAGLDTGSLSTIDASLAQSPLPPMASQNLAAVTDGPRTSLAVAPGADLASISGTGASLLGRAELFVRATGATTVARTGTVLHAHTLVDLDGVGQRHSGVWLVDSVRHLIDPVAHRMEFTLARNGWEA
jgi:hypothetical protein